jgi:hypothetical protein
MGADLPEPLGRQVGNSPQAARQYLVVRYHGLLRVAEVDRGGQRELAQKAAHLAVHTVAAHYDGALDGVTVLTADADAGIL